MTGCRSLYLFFFAKQQEAYDFEVRPFSPAQKIKYCGVNGVIAKRLKESSWAYLMGGCGTKAVSILLETIIELRMLTHFVNVVFYQTGK